MTRACTFVDLEEYNLIYSLYAKGNAITRIATLAGRSQRTIRDVLSKPAPDQPPRCPCPDCGVLIAPGQPCPDCEADKEARKWREMELDDSRFGGPTLPPKERVVREGPPMCEVMLGG